MSPSFLRCRLFVLKVLMPVPTVFILCLIMARLLLSSRHCYPTILTCSGVFASGSEDIGFPLDPISSKLFYNWENDGELVPFFLKPAVPSSPLAYYRTSLGVCLIVLIAWQSFYYLFLCSSLSGTELIRVIYLYLHYCLRTSGLFCFLCSLHYPKHPQ